jgi:PAS domain S-box-containing protein
MTFSTTLSQSEAAYLDEQSHQLCRLAAIVQSSEDAILSKSLDDVVTTWNQGAEKLFGYTSEEMIGQSYLKLVPFHFLPLQM